MPTFGTPTTAVVLSDDDLVANGTRVARRAGGTRGEARSVRSLPRLAGSLA